MHEEINKLEDLLAKQQSTIKAQAKLIDELRAQLQTAETRMAELQADLYSKKYG